jgi:hypothetical protein
MASSFDGSAYGEAFGVVLAKSRLNPLDGGDANEAAKPGLEGLSLDSAFKGEPVLDEDMASACISAVWLYHNFLDESHTLSQQIDTPTGSFWHGIMHRREPDFSNSKYWFQKVNDHETFPAISKAVSRIATGKGAEAAVLTNSPWDPFGFVDLCEAGLNGNSALDEICRTVQQIEWEILFDYSYKKAIGK